MPFLSRLSFQARVSLLGICLIAVTVAAMISFYVIDLQDRAVIASVEKARSICLSAESAREQKQKEWTSGLVSHQDVLESYQKGQDELGLLNLPIVSAWSVAMSKSDQGGYEFRVPALEARSPENEPDEIERVALQTLRDEGLSEYHIVDKDQNSVRYFRPVFLSESCMVCHGDPAQSQEVWGNDEGYDITGHKMENWAVGDMHGAFEVINSLDQADDMVVQGVTKAGIGALFALLISGVSTVFVVRLTMKKLGSAIGSISRATDSLRNSSSELDEVAKQTSSESDSMATAIGEVSETVQQLSNASTELTASIQEIASNATSAAHIATTAVEEAEVANKVIDNLAQSSNKIGDVIAVINSLADQTSLLALNATIEAARAGEAGKGFAVVANEVKELANETSTATKQIVESISAIQSDSRNGEEAVRRISEIIGSINEAQHAIACAVEEQSATSAGIDQNIREVADTGDALSQRVAVVSDNTRRTATQVEDSRGQVEEIEKMVVGVNEMISAS